MKQSQLEWIKQKLIENGKISRNECLRNYISRLSGRILDLKQSGWEIEGENENGDYVYYLKNKQLKLL